MRIDQHQNIPDAFFAIANSQPSLPVYTQAILPNSASERTLVRRNYREVKERVLALASYLQSLGCKSGTQIGILSGTRAEWMEADLAILATGGTSVSIYQSLPAPDIAYILFDSQTSIIFAENQEQVEKLLTLLEQDVDIAGTEDRSATKTRIQIQKIIAFEEVTTHPLVVQFDNILRTVSATHVNRLSEIQTKDLAALVYTSGTTGPPKGVMQSHGNHLANVRQAFECHLVHERSSILLFLPLAHSFAKLMGYIGFLTPVELFFPAVPDKRSSKADPRSILQDIRELPAELVPVVPRFLEKMKEGIEAESRKQGLKANLIRLTLWASLSNYRARNSGKRLPVSTQIAYQGTQAIRHKIKRQLFSSTFRMAVSGGAKLPVEVAVFFDALGIEIIEGYGLTETCVATNVNRSGSKIIGSVGPVLAPDIELQLSQEGEVLFRGPNIALGYFGRPTATAASWDKEGWFHTGDLGAVDAQGYLSIIGRKKELIVTSGGKKIPPAAIEDRLKSVTGVSQAVLIGDGRPFCVALVTLNYPAVEDWAKRLGVSHVKSWETNPQLLNHIRQEMETINSTLSSFETIKNFLIIPEEFTVENGLLTPTFKIKRSAIEKRYQTEIAGLYVETRRN